MYLYQILSSFWMGERKNLAGYQSNERTDNGKIERAKRVGREKIDGTGKSATESKLKKDRRNFEDER